MPTALTASLAERFAAIALWHVEREYPNKPGHVLDGPEDAGRGITWASIGWRVSRCWRSTR